MAPATTVIRFGACVLGSGLNTYRTAPYTPSTKGESNRVIQTSLRESMLAVMTAPSNELGAKSRGYDNTINTGRILALTTNRHSVGR